MKSDLSVSRAERPWIELVVPCTREAAEGTVLFINQIDGDLDVDLRYSIGMAFRELLLNAVEWGGRLDPRHRVRITCVRTDRMLMYRIADPGPGFTFENLDHAAITHPDDPIGHMKVRDEKGLRAGGFVCLVADRDLSAKGVPVTFFGRNSRMPAGPAALSVRTGAPLIPVTLYYEGPDLVITFHDVVDKEGGLAAMTQRCADAFAEGIAAHPQDWHMMQRIFLDS